MNEADGVETKGNMACDGMSCDEAARAMALVDHGLRGWNGDGAFDEIVGLLARICDAPIVLVSLVEEEEQRFLARTGIDATSTPRSVSFCAHAMLGRDIMVVPDALADPRFSANALVTGDPHTRFYAGAPLVTRTGVPLGALCVIDTVPRDGLTAVQRDAMRVLAANVMTIVEARRETEARDLIERELGHRIKNLFTLFQGLIHFSGGEGDAATARSQLLARTTALASAHALIVPGAQDAAATGFHALVATLLAPYRTDGLDRFRIDGDDLSLPAALVTPFALVFHELTTNAAKYGALSRDGGMIDVQLRRSSDRVVIEWRESAGERSLAETPVGNGFGTRLVDAVVTRQLGATLARSWEDGGLSVRLDMPHAALG